jgi:hypothetical protein
MISENVCDKQFFQKSAGCLCGESKKVQLDQGLRWWKVRLKTGKLHLFYPFYV